MENKIHEQIDRKLDNRKEKLENFPKSEEKKGELSCYKKRGRRQKI